MKPRIAVTALALALIIGCASPQDMMYDSAKRQPTTAVDFYREGTKPEKAYKEIGELSYDDFGSADAHAMKVLIQRAKKLGADAIIMQPRKDTGYYFNAFGRSGNKYLWKAIAVVYSTAP